MCMGCWISGTRAKQPGATRTPLPAARQRQRSRNTTCGQRGPCDNASFMAATWRAAQRIKGGVLMGEGLVFACSRRVCVASRHLQALPRPTQRPDCAAQRSHPHCQARECTLRQVRAEEPPQSCPLRDGCLVHWSTSICFWFALRSWVVCTFTPACHSGNASICD